MNTDYLHFVLSLIFLQVRCQLSVFNVLFTKSYSPLEIRNYYKVYVIAQQETYLIRETIGLN